MLGLLALLWRGVAAADLPLNPNLSVYDVLAYCPNQTWTAINNSTYSVSGPVYLFVNSSQVSSAAQTSLQISPGFASNDSFALQVSNQTCSNQAGGYAWTDNATAEQYRMQFDGSGDGTALQSVWSLSDYNPGVLLDSRALAVVLYDAFASKVACCDLKMVSRFASCSAFTGLNANSGSGFGKLYTTSTSTVGVLNVSFASGYADDSAFQAQVFNQSCSNSQGGSQWKFNAASSDSSASNALTWNFMGTGNGSNTLSNWNQVISDENFAANDLVRSIVVKDPSGAKALCCDLTLSVTTTVSSSGFQPDPTPAKIAAGIVVPVIVAGTSFMIYFKYFVTPEQFKKSTSAAAAIR